MSRIVLTYGLIAGIVVSLSLILLTSNGGINMENGEIIGYTVMIIALSTIFFGVRTYRDQHLGGSISFGKAFTIGLYIALVASTIYVLSWLVISGTVRQDFMNEYYTHTVEELRQSDLPEAEVEAKIAEMDEFREMYKNPLVKIGVTYLEILPVGLLVSLISAFLLRRRQTSRAA